ncbi:hypothetical protein [Saccharopolyspora phatthalungensis]|uniref:Uncharacterized protein n=1 Tax=Saccharopolyspora phatthalungensis TaxID=664693 RepID=A0A840Q5C3_9PSEU|nr:hypothetical protein [Saccharopolyspora phatthalungensis]MBB5153928.1 hypothetical protein [Saccharopolyspora phatthalungensis]
MVIERNRWVRRLLVVQPTMVWPVSFLLWSDGGDVGLAAAVILLWASAAVCIAGIIVPMRSQQTPRC